MNPTLNGYSPDWSSAEIVLNVPGGATLDDFDVQAITCSTSVEIGIQRGKGGQKKARGVGVADHEGSLTLYRSGYRALVRALKANAPTNSAGQKQIGLVHFDIFYKHTPPGSAEIFGPIKLLGLRMSGQEFSGAEGSDLEMVTVPLNVMSIVEVIDGEEVVLL